MNRFRVWRWMSAPKIPEATHLPLWLYRRSDDPLKPTTRLRFQRRHHRMRRFADGNYEHSRIGIEIVQVLANAQHSALAAYVTRKRTLNRSVFQCGREDLTGDVPHLPELLLALGSDLHHNGDYRVARDHA